MATRVVARSFERVLSQQQPQLQVDHSGLAPRSSPAGLEAAVASFNGSFLTFLGTGTNGNGDVTDSSVRGEDSDREIGNSTARENLRNPMLGGALAVNHGSEADHGLVSDWDGDYRDGDAEGEDDLFEDEHGEEDQHDFLDHVTPGDETEDEPLPSIYNLPLLPNYAPYPSSTISHDHRLSEVPPSPVTSTAAEDPELSDVPYIPPLSRPRTAHPRAAYKNEDELSDLDEELIPVREDGDDGNFQLPGPHRSRSTTSSRSKSRSQSPRSTSSYGTRTKLKRKASSRSNSEGRGGSAGLGLRRTELPAVEDDPTIKPYGCHFPSCMRLNSSSASPSYSSASTSSSTKGKGRSESTESTETAFRTIRELREHCAVHRRKGEKPGPGDTAFRCALDPCGKVFKSAAGLLWHFTNASAGHFFVSIEEGEDRPSKKFKRIVESSGKNEKCPVPGCTKAFKQPSGLAYHLAHAPLHPQHVSEELLTNCSTKLKSKVRWWFSKLGVVIPQTTRNAVLGTPESFEDEDEEEEEEPRGRVAAPKSGKKVVAGIGKWGQWGNFDEEEDENDEWADLEEN